MSTIQEIILAIIISVPVSYHYERTVLLCNFLIDLFVVLQLRDRY